MSAEKSTPKIFIQIVKELREIIRVENIKPGEKLPSERVLAEQLGVGRSSVREALRSMELLGLIETKRGGGTFLADYKNHKLVEVLSTFILQQEKDVTDVHIARQIYEKDAVMTIAANEKMRQLPVWSSLLNNLTTEGFIEREILVRELIVTSEKRLVFKIWILLNQFGESIYRGFSTQQEKPALTKFLQTLIAGNATEAVQTYEEWVSLLEKEENDIHEY